MEPVSNVASEPISCDEECVDIPETEGKIPAFTAVRDNDLAALEKLFLDGFDVDFRCPASDKSDDKVYTVKDATRTIRHLRLKQYSLLHVAVIHGTTETVRWLVSRGAAVNSTDQNNMSPLFVAAAIQRPDVMKFLINNGADVNVQSASGRTPLIQAIENNDLTAVQHLIAAGADLNLADMKGTTPLFAFVNGRRTLDLNILRALLSPGGSIIDLPNRLGATPLMMAVGLGRIEAAQVFLDAGANINKSDRSGKSVFHMAPGLNTAYFLITNGADCDLPDKAGKRPLDKAAESGHLRLLQLLLLCDCHRSVAIMDQPRVVYLRQTLPVFDQWLQQELYNPRELKRLCRQSIRHTLGPDNLPHVDQLPLPRLMKDFLWAKHLDFSLGALPGEPVLRPEGGGIGAGISVGQLGPTL